MKVLDLFCGAGGAGVGYARAGFDVTGIDSVAQPDYPYRFVQADAIEYLREHGAEYDLIHASPPCQSYSVHVSSRSSRWVPTLGKDEPRLIAPTREAMPAGTPYIIENVASARPELHAPIMLCGAMFDLPIARHRLFEAGGLLIEAPEHRACRGIAKRYAEARGWEYRDMSVTGKGRHAGTLARWQKIMGIDWPMTQHQMAEAIPPSYTHWIGGQAIAQIAGCNGRAMGLVRNCYAE